MQYFEFQFDSRDADKSFSANLASLDWPAFLFSHNLEGVAFAKILEAQIPYTFYTIDSGSNILVVTEATNSVPVTFTVAIPPGSYTPTSICTTLSTLLTSASHSSGNSNDYVVTFDTNSLKLQISKTTKLSYLFSILVPSTALARILGLSPNSTSTVEPGTLHQIIVASFVFTSTKYVYVNSATLGSLVNMYLPESSPAAPGGGGGTQIAKIPCTAKPGDVIYWQDPCPEKWFSIPQLNSFSQMDFFLTADSAAPLKLNGESFSLKLGVLAYPKTVSAGPSAVQSITQLMYAPK